MIAHLTRGGFGRLASVAMLSAVTTAAHAAKPQIQCTPGFFGGVSACAVDMSLYAVNAITGRAICPPTVQSTGPAPVCAESFAAAMADARLYFQTPATSNSTYVVRLDAGVYDLTSQTSLPQGQTGVIDVGHIQPGGAGCIDRAASETGDVVLTGNGCLVITGDGAASTVLITADGLSEVHGQRVSHLLIENINFAKPLGSTTQGAFVASGVQRINGVAYPTLTIDVPAGMPTPLALYQLNCAASVPFGCTPRGLPSVVNDVYARAYTGGATPQPVLSTSLADQNGQYAFGYPQAKGVTAAAVPPMQPDAVNFPRRWTLVMSPPANARAIPAQYTQTSAGVPNIICLKYDNGPAFWFDDLAGGGTDIIVNQVIWTGAARTTFRGVRGALSGSPRGAQIYNSTIARGPAIGGVTPCLSTQAGGIQIGQPHDPPIWGNAIYNLRAEATADDTVAIFNDIGGTRGTSGVYYPQSWVRQSSLLNSFGRDLKLYNDHAFSGLAGNSPVLVDAQTQEAISEAGACDPLLGSCPVDYLSY